MDDASGWGSRKDCSLQTASCERLCAGFSKRGASGRHNKLLRKSKDGTANVTHDAIHGTVSSVSATSISVKASDGYSLTFAVNADTKVRVRDTSSTGKRAGRVGMALCIVRLTLKRLGIAGLSWLLPAGLITRRSKEALVPMCCGFTFCSGGTGWPTRRDQSDRLLPLGLDSDLSPAPPHRAFPFQTIPDEAPIVSPTCHRPCLNKAGSADLWEWNVLR